MPKCDAEGFKKELELESFRQKRIIPRTFFEHGNPVHGIKLLVLHIS